MPKIQGIIGTGITKRGVVTFDWNDPADVAAQIEAAVSTFEHTSFDHLSREIVNLAERILSDAGLPADVSGFYTRATDGTWSHVEKLPRSRSDRDKLLTLPELFLKTNYAADSPQGYAIKLLILIDKASMLASKGSVDEAMATAFAIGQQINEAANKEIWEEDALRGEKVLASARSGHAQVHGTEQAKAARRANYRDAFQKAQANGLSKMEAYEEVAAQFGVASRTIERAVARLRG